MIPYFAVDVSSHIAATSVGYGLKYIVDKARVSLLKDRLVRKAWGFLHEQTHVFLPLANVTGVGAAGGFGDLLALSGLIVMANKYALSDNMIVHTDPRDFANARNENLVIIGGGKYNSIYRTLIEALNVPLHFFDTATESFQEIRNRERSIVYAPECDGEGNVTQDIGLAVRAKNSSNPGKWVVIAAGSYTYGSAAAMQFLLTPETLKEVKNELEHSVEVIVGASVNQHAATNIRRISQIHRFG